jgi:protein phosphatase
MTIDLAAKTHVGLKRTENEDVAVAEVLVDGEKPLAWVAVADGMGGHTKGAEASRRAIECLRAGLAQRLADEGPCPTVEWCIGFEEAAHEGVRKIGTETEMAGTTLTFALVHGSECFIGHVGDSRAYRFRDGSLEPLTEDHTWEAYAATQGVENPHGKALRQAVGVEGDFEPDGFQVALGPDDRLLICSDGFYKMVDLSEAASTLGNARDASDACDRLVRLALEGGGKDNISVCVARFGQPAGRSRCPSRRVLAAVAGAVVVAGVLAILAFMGRI